MNAEELRATANTVDALDSSEAIALANHILATVREDDDEPVTLAWLEQLARVDGTLRMMSVVWRLDGFHFSANGHESPTPATRGEFRALCRLLGVTLKEPTPAGHYQDLHQGGIIMEHDQWQFRINTYCDFGQLSYDLTLESANGWQLVHIDEQRYLTGQSTGPAWYSTFRCLLKKRQEEARK